MSHTRGELCTRGTFSPRQKCPPLGGTFLPGETFYPRQKCPPGHSFLGTVTAMPRKKCPGGQ